MTPDTQNPTPKTQHPPPAVGDRIQGRWEICQILKGGMGVVYIVFDHEHRMPYAAKTFRDDKHTDNTETAADFVDEALAWVNLDAHPNIVRAEFVQMIEGKPFLFLEYVSGGDLDAWIGTPRLTENLSQVLRFAIQFCDGMIHAAAKGIEVHRDIKPSNCLITADGTLKISDFGLAKVYDLRKSIRQNASDAKNAANASDATAGSGAGTSTYMAPEQFDDVDRVDLRADVYSFGVLLFEMITGKLPFDGDGWDELKQQHQIQAPSPLPGSLPSTLIKVVNTCLSKKPADRFAGFGSLRSELAAIYEQLTAEKAWEPAVGAELDAVEWSNKGVSLSHLQRYAEAIACYEQALELNPELKEAWNNKGMALTALQRYPEALECFERALALDPSFALARNNKGRTFEYLGRRSEALTCYGHALALDPNLVTGKFTRWAARTLLSCQRLLETTHMLRCAAPSPRINVLPMYASARRLFARLASGSF
jgi:serine/threonine protein kinase